MAVETAGKAAANFFAVPLLDVDGCRFEVIAGGGGETVTQVDGVWLGAGEGVGFGLGQGWTRRGGVVVGRALVKNELMSDRGPDGGLGDVVVGEWAGGEVAEEGLEIVAIAGVERLPGEVLGLGGAVAEAEGTAGVGKKLGGGGRLCPGDEKCWSRGHRRRDFCGRIRGARMRQTDSCRIGLG